MGRTLGWFGEDVWDAATSVVEDVFSTVGDFPGVKQLSEAGGDFARTSVGKVVLRALSSSLYGSFAWSLGPQLASVFWATPGLVRGEPFEKAWFDELKYRTEKTAEILGPGIVDVFGKQLADTLKKLGSDLGVGNLINDSVNQLAKRYNIREDVAAFVKSLWNKLELPDMSRFDPATGRALGFLEQGAFIFEAGKVETRFYSASMPLPMPSPLSTFQPGVMPAGVIIGGKHFEPSPAPAPLMRDSSALSPSSQANRASGDLLLGAVVVGAAGALWAWYRYQSGKPLWPF